MDRRTSYDDDIYAWSQEQAAALRRLAETRRDLPNELDLEHVAEEIEDVGKAELRTVESFLELMLRHLLKIASAPDARPVRHWRDEVVLQRRALDKDLKNSMRQLLDLDEMWDTAVKRADAALDEHGDALLPELPQACPFSLEELTAGSFEIDSAVARLQELSAKRAGGAF
ncbi:DUF29 domain-containing protein [Enterovirga sp. CN4-39]|uniref:DUF29 domain-containing protein n=1 Tax=Enterovirga sp. CN4-39 TaxID=3400910 RepID=UPI003C03D87D